MMIWNDNEINNETIILKNGNNEIIMKMIMVMIMKIVMKIMV